MLPELVVCTTAGVEGAYDGAYPIVSPLWGLPELSTDGAGLNVTELGCAAAAAALWKWWNPSTAHVGVGG